VSPPNPAVTAGETLGFSALVAGANNPPQTVTWSVEGGVEGTAISADGRLSAAAAETAASLTVRAVSTFDTTKSGRANVTVVAADPEPDPDPDPEPEPDPEQEPDPEPEPEPETPQLAGTVSITGTAKVGETLTVNESGLTNKSGTATYQWKRDGGAIPGAATATYTLVQDDAGHAITVVVSYSGNTGSVTSAATGAVELRELGGTVSILGETRVGQQLTVDESALLYQAGTPAYQWKKNGTNIGTNSTTYLIETADLGATITVVVSYSGNAGNVTSAATAAVGKQLLTGSISITGTAREGETLTANSTGINGSGAITYQWKRGDTNIGTNSNSYSVTPSDVGSAITVQVTRADLDGSLSATTAAVTIKRDFSVTFNYPDGARTAAVKDERAGNPATSLATEAITTKLQNVVNEIVAYTADLGADVVHANIKAVLAQPGGMVIEVRDNVANFAEATSKKILSIQYNLLTDETVTNIADHILPMIEGDMYQLMTR
jgi:hypothetical protein